MEKYMPITKQLRLRRQALGLSQEELGFRIRASQRQISDWEICRHYPRLDRLLDWARALGVTLRLVG